MKHWFIYNKKADFEAIAKQFHISTTLAKIIRNRDLERVEDIEVYLNGDLSSMHDPFLLDDMEKACGIIWNAVREKKKIRIVGDYDIDGVCGSYILKTGLRFFGADVDVAIPNRMEDGYGINEGMVDSAAENGVELIITCDNGIRALGPAKRAAELGIQMIITDHHEIPEELPEADAVINPHLQGSLYPYPDLCGAAVAFKLILALAEQYTGKKDTKELFQHAELSGLLNEILMFAGFATVGDVVPLQKENRIFVKEGLKRLRECRNIGMNALIKEKQLDPETLDAYHIGFILGPCVNSAGRLSDAYLALRLFESKEQGEAETLAHHLSELNEERKRMTDEQTWMAKRYFQDLFERKGTVDRVLGVYLEDAHESVAGIIAGRIREEYYRPAFVVTKGEDGLKGSGRSIEAYNMIEEISKQGDLFEKFGGHAMACGFTLKKGKFHDMIRLLNDNCTLGERDLIPKTWIDMRLPLEEISEELVEELEKIRPFGQANAKPLFAEKDLYLNSFRILGQKQNVLRFFLENQNGLKMDGVMFGSSPSIAEKYEELKKLQSSCAGRLKLAILFYPQINEFRDMRKIELQIRDFDISR